MHSKLMIDLDSIYDTRLAILNEVDIMAVPLVLRTYHYRETDNFNKLSDGIIDMSLYHEAYAKRDIGTIKSSYRTSILEAMKALITQTLTGPWEDAEITVNVYPFQLTDEVKDAIAEGVGHALNCHTKCTSISNEMLTPSVLDEWDCYISYNFHDWLETNGDALIKRRIRTMCYYPRIMDESKVPLDPHGKELTGTMLEKVKSMDKFASLELLYSTTISMSALPSKFFSAAPAQLWDNQESDVES